MKVENKIMKKKKMECKRTLKWSKTCLSWTMCPKRRKDEIERQRAIDMIATSVSAFHWRNYGCGFVFVIRYDEDDTKHSGCCCIFFLGFAKTVTVLIKNW